MCVDFFCLISCSSLTCTNCPYRFVSQDDLTEVFSRQAKQRTFNLSIYYFKVLSSFSFFQYFTNTEDRSQTVSQS